MALPELLRLFHFASDEPAIEEQMIDESEIPATTNEGHEASVISVLISCLFKDSRKLGLKFERDISCFNEFKNND
jgi:hypothetical protein